MLNKNNYGEELKNKFSIRKLNVGATAVLLGFAFWASSQTAKADTIVPNYQAENSKTGGVTKVGKNKLATYSGLSSFLKAQADAKTPIKPGKPSAEKPLSNNNSNIAAEAKDKSNLDASQVDPNDPNYDPSSSEVNKIKTKWNNVDVLGIMDRHSEDSWLTIFGGTDAAPAIMKPAEGEDTLQKAEFLPLEYEGIQTITIKGKIKVYGDASELFAFLEGLKEINGLENLDTSEVTNMSRMFTSDQWLTKIDVSHFDTSKVTNMEGMFSGCESLSSLDLSSFNTASVHGPVDNDHPDTSGLYDMLESYSLRILTLGQKFKIFGKTDLGNLPGKWINWGMANKKLHKGSNQWSSQELSEKYNGVRDYDTYVRFTNLAAPITIQYRNLKGQKFPDIANDIEFGNVGDSLIDAKNPDSILSFKYKNIPGYGFDHAQIGKEKIDLKKIKYTNTPQTITLFYFEYPSSALVRASVTVHYKDEFGNTLAPDKVLNGYAGNSYVTDPATINDYTLKVRPTNATGLFKSDPQNVTYIYSLNSSVPKETAISKKGKHHHLSKKQHQSENRRGTINRVKNLNAGAKSSQTLPQTGSNKRASLIALGLGSLVLIGALGISYLSNKKKD